MAQLRSLLVHEFAKKENEIIYGILKKRLDEFAGAAVAYVGRQEVDESKPKRARERRGKYAVRKRKTAR